MVGIWTYPRRVCKDSRKPADQYSRAAAQSKTFQVIAPMENYTLVILNAIKADVIDMPYRGRGAQLLKNDILDKIDQYVAELSKEADINC